MKRLLIACETLKDEVELAIKNTGQEVEVVWMSNLLHDSPERLSSALQEEIDAVEEDYDQLLFAYGNCGNGLLGLKSEKAQLIIPKIDDCIGMCLSNKTDLARIRTKTYFLTAGWLRSEKSLSAEHAHHLEKYGEERTKMIYEMLYKNYQDLMLIDTGAYDIEEWLEETKKIGENLGLNIVIEKGTVTPLERLVSGDWDEEFLIIESGRVTVQSDFMDF
ncbi:DUF1638 domain-containing protein [Eubacteriaceae bacterium ES3]|nr:DUF1638 domain-containing protein [Eubacteriaceae bacterium ES3]